MAFTGNPFDDGHGGYTSAWRIGVDGRPESAQDDADADRAEAERAVREGRLPKDLDGDGKPDYPEAWDPPKHQATGNPLNDEDRSPFLSFLDYLDEPGQVVKNLLRGNLGAAGRHVLNFAGDTIDSVLPGDWIPKATNAEDNVSSSELIGLDEKEHPILGFGANLIGDTLLNPLSYLSMGTAGAGASAGKAAVKAGLPFLKGALEVPGSAKAIEAVGGLAKKGFQALPEGVQQGAEALGRGVRSTFGAPRLKPETQQILNAARAAKSAETSAGAGAIKASALKGMSDQELNAVGDIIDNRLWKDGKMVDWLDKDSTSALDRVALHPDVTPVNADRVRQAVSEVLEIGKNQAKRPGIFTQRASDVSKMVMPGGRLVEHDSAPKMAEEYLQRHYTGMTEDDALGEALGQPSAVKGRTLDTFEKQKQFLDENPKVAYERNAAIRLGKRAEQQGTLAQRADIGKALSGDHFSYADPEMRAGVVKTIEGMAKESPEDAQVLMDAFKGMAPRGKAMQAIVNLTTPFKKAAVYGFGIPKFGSIVRNAVSGVWQAAANPESRGTALKALGNLDRTIGGAVVDSLGMTYPRDRLVGTLRALDDAMGKSGGLAENAAGVLEQAGTQEAKDAAMVLRSGVLDGFVRGEDLAKEIARSPSKEKLANVLDWPGRMFRGVEDRMRAGMFLDLVHGGKPAEEAARITRDSLYDYATNSVANRRARDFIPFFQFQAKAIPQTAKLLAEKPAVATAMASAMGRGNDDPVYPFMEGKLNVPLGTNEAGGEDYLTGLGLPFEAMNTIPGSFRDVKRNIVGSANPLMKSLFAQVSGEDPYFETPVGSYDKVPVFGHQGDLGKAYNQLAGTGLIQPLDSLLRPIDQAADPRRSAAIKALDLLTGAKVASVDPDVALQQQLTEALKTNPDVHQYRGFFADKGDEPTQALIRAYQRAKEKTKRKRKAAKP